jgi:hypothetical protein
VPIVTACINFILLRIHPRLPCLLALLTKLINCHYCLCGEGVIKAAITINNNAYDFSVNMKDAAYL